MDSQPASSVPSKLLQDLPSALSLSLWANGMIGRGYDMGSPVMVGSIAANIRAARGQCGHAAGRPTPSVQTVSLCSSTMLLAKSEKCQGSGDGVPDLRVQSDSATCERRIGTVVLSSFSRLGPIVETTRRNGDGSSLPRQNNLFVDVEGKDWRIMVCRRDGEPCDCFGDHHGHAITADVLRTFIPNWNSLTWLHSPVFHSRALCAKDGEFEIRLLTIEGSPLSDSQILAEFKKVMADAQNAGSPLVGRTYDCERG